MNSCWQAPHSALPVTTRKQPVYATCNTGIQYCCVIWTDASVTQLYW